MSPYPYISRFLVSCQARNMSAATLRAYRYHLDAYAAGLAAGEDWRTVDSVERHLAERLRSGKAPATVTGDYRVLAVFFSWCAERGVVAANPMAAIAKPRIPRRRQRTASAEDVAALLASIPAGDWLNMRDRLIVQLLFLTAIRVNELVSLHLADVDLHTDTIVVRNKGGDDRRVPLLRPVVEAIVAYRYVRPPVDADWLIVSASSSRQPKPRPMTTSGIRQRLHVLCDLAGIGYLNPHSFRHGLAVHLLNDRGADMSLIQAILGHRSIATTASVYALWQVDGVSSQFARLMDGG